MTTLAVLQGAFLSLRRSLSITTNSTDSDQASHRLNRARLATIWAFVSKLGSLSVTLISIPLAITTLGADRFGIWITITTLFTLFSFLDGGIGNAVVNMVADQRAARNEERLRSVVSSAYLLLMIVGGLGSLLSAVLAFTVDWKWAISLPADISQGEVAISALIVGILFFVNIPLSLVTKIRQGLQESHINFVFDILSYCTILVATTVAWYFQASLNYFLLAFAIGPVITSGANTLYFIFRKGSILAPKLRFVSKEIAKECLSTGSLFLGLQICSALAYQTDALIVSHLVGLKATAELGLVNRMFLIATSFTAFFIVPLWPAFRDAAARGEIEWIKKVFWLTLRKSIFISLAITLPLLLGYKPIIAAWVGRSVEPGFLLVLAVFLWTNIAVVGSLITAMLNGLNLIRLQLIIGVVMVLMNLPISVVLTQRMGPSGVVFGSIIAYSLFVLVPIALILPGRIRLGVSRPSC